MRCCLSAPTLRAMTGRWSVGVIDEAADLLAGRVFGNGTMDT
ncbi:MAG: hypothetical protein JWR81_3230 [Pseudonocardia sp.]|jgi:hypothetical protein|nr:hypothetical protein [Pseudonocardia sp.]MDT7616160.1 hypothetical protein [Pseudonocardiales bacterium]